MDQNYSKIKNCTRGRGPDSGFVVEINDRFLLRKLPSRNLTSIYLIAVVLLQARHCSVKSHPFPFLSLPPSSVRAYVLLSLLPSSLPCFIHIIPSSPHELVFARRGAARRLLSAKREPYCHLLVHNMSTRAFVDGFVFVVGVGKGTRDAVFLILSLLSPFDASL